jgi:hypothetical protein
VGKRDRTFVAECVTHSLCHAGLHSDVSSVLVGAMRPLLSNIKNTKRGVKQNERTEFKLNQIVESNYCRYDLHSGCVQGEADATTCAKCVAESAAEIVRTQL